LRSPRADRCCVHSSSADSCRRQTRQHVPVGLTWWHCCCGPSCLRWCWARTHSLRRRRREPKQTLAQRPHAAGHALGSPAATTAPAQPHAKRWGAVGCRLAATPGASPQTLGTKRPTSPRSARHACVLRWQRQPAALAVLAAALQATPASCYCCSLRSRCCRILGPTSSGWRWSWSCRHRSACTSRSAPQHPRPRAGRSQPGSCPGAWRACVCGADAQAAGQHAWPHPQQHARLLRCAPQAGQRRV
jgi:hypothetical protein